LAHSRVCRQADGFGRLGGERTIRTIKIKPKTVNFNRKASEKGKILWENGFKDKLFHLNDENYSRETSQFSASVFPVQAKKKNL